MLLSFERSRRIRAIVGFNDGYFFSGFDVGSREGESSLKIEIVFEKLVRIERRRNRESRVPRWKHDVETRAGQKQ